MPARSRRSGHRVRQVAGRGAGEHRESELARGRQRDRDDPVLERVRRVAAVVLHPQPPHAELAGKVVREHQLCHAWLEIRRLRDVGRNRQQLLVAPDVVRPGFDRLAAHTRVVVGHFERPEAHLARIARADRILLSALATRQRGGRPQEGANATTGRGRTAGGDWVADTAKPLSSSSPRTIHGTELAPVSPYCVSREVVAGASTGRSLCPS